MALPLANPWVEALPVPKPLAGPHSADPGDLLLHLGEAWFRPAPDVAKALKKLEPRLARYPDSLSRELRSELARYTGFAEESILPGNGSDALIDQLVTAYAGPGVPVAAPAPTFFVYGHSAALRRAPLIATGRLGQEAAFAFHTDEFLHSLPLETGLIFLASPNNPTGDALDEETVERVARSTRALVVVDECYYEFAGTTAANLIPKYPNLAVLRSLSKSFALAGLRAGYLLAHPSVISTLTKVDQTFSVNVAAQLAAVTALRSLDYYRPQFAATVALRAQWAEMLGSLGLRIFRSEANILLANYSHLLAEPLAPLLLQRGIHVADFHARPPVHECIRLTVGELPALARTRQALTEILPAPTHPR